MEFAKVFLMNISLLVTFGYVSNLVYKYLFTSISLRLKIIFSVFLFIFAGWFTMLFSLQLTETARFDLRFVPVIVAILVYRQPVYVVLIGIGIAAARLTFGITEASVAGFINLFLLGVYGGLLNAYFNRSSWTSLQKSVTSVLFITTMHTLQIALIGVYPFHIYMTEIAPMTYPLGIVLSFFFIFIIRDFYKEQERLSDLRNMNILLRRQTRELREAKRQLEDKARQLMLASQYKSEFLANMSHELKTPLNSIILLSQMIRESSDERQDERAETEDEARYAALIHAAGNELLQLINDILDLSKVEAGKMDVNPENVPTDELLHMIAEPFLPSAQQKGLSFEVIIDRDVPKSVMTDALRLSQVLRNLLVNAIKFTEEGGVILHVQVERQKLAPQEAVLQWLVFTVRDTGIGIEEEKQQYIFEAFQQADGSVNRKYGGTGLGLSISLQLARLLGGTLSLSSKIGEGSAFSLRLPLLYHNPEQ